MYACKYRRTAIDHSILAHGQGFFNSLMPLSFKSDRFPTGTRRQIWTQPLATYTLNAVQAWLYAIIF